MEDKFARHHQNIRSRACATALCRKYRTGGDMAVDRGWQHEVRDAMRSEAWTIFGPSRLVKVVSVLRPMVHSSWGYVTSEKSLFGKTPFQIEVSLGLPAGELSHGCRIYRLARLPMPSEVRYELTAAHPDGEAYAPTVRSEKYKPGDPSIHQWRLLADVPNVHLIDLAPNDRFQYVHN